MADLAKINTGKGCNSNSSQWVSPLTALLPVLNGFKILVYLRFRSQGVIERVFHNFKCEGRKADDE